MIRGSAPSSLEELHSEEFDMKKKRERGGKTVECEKEREGRSRLIKYMEFDWLIAFTGCWCICI